MDLIFKEINYAIVYVDDILIVSENIDEHRTYLLNFAKIRKENGLVLSEKKVKIEQEEIEFLGLILNKNGIKLQSLIGKKIIEFPDKIENKKELQQFFGCLNYAESFIENLAKKRNLLQKLLKENNTKRWDENLTKLDN